MKKREFEDTPCMSGTKNISSKKKRNTFQNPKQKVYDANSAFSFNVK
jgi:hypothetical protein